MGNYSQAISLYILLQDRSTYQPSTNDSCEAQCIGTGTSAPYLGKCEGSFASAMKSRADPETRSPVSRIRASKGSEVHLVHDEIAEAVSANLDGLRPYHRETPGPKERLRGDARLRVQAAESEPTRLGFDPGEQSRGDPTPLILVVDVQRVHVAINLHLRKSNDHIVYSRHEHSPRAAVLGDALLPHLRRRLWSCPRLDLGNGIIPNVHVKDRTVEEVGDGRGVGSSGIPDFDGHEISPYPSSTFESYASGRRFSRAGNSSRRR